MPSFSFSLLFPFSTLVDLPHVRPWELRRRPARPPSARALDRGASTGRLAVLAVGLRLPAAAVWRSPSRQGPPRPQCRRGPDLPSPSPDLRLPWQDLRRRRVPASRRWRKELHIAAAATGSGGEEGRTRAGAPLLTCAHCRSPTCVPWVVAARAGCRSPTCSDDNEEPVPSTTVLARCAPSSLPDVKPPLLAEDWLRCGRPIAAAARGRGSVARSGARPRTQDAAGTRGPSPRRRGRVPPCRRPGVAAWRRVAGRAGVCTRAA
ncbi:hypothetical protein PVAP13_2KG262012 [Panicum virgatum]|uniref:Uncharacterized protein n=1 Tax=Panicum virgatum TaxID=38727 RepID=A0A8T0VZY0_PANVG|nr:hypothetical protein PVAP13_2KG262012 [Panicum virgatum]